MPDRGRGQYFPNAEDGSKKADHYDGEQCVYKEHQLLERSLFFIVPDKGQARQGMDYHHQESEQDPGGRFVKFAVEHGSHRDQSCHYQAAYKGKKKEFLEFCEVYHVFASVRGFVKLSNSPIR